MRVLLDPADASPSRPRRCQCGGDDVPGRCPGVSNCPYADHDDDEPEPAED